MLELCVALCWVFDRTLNKKKPNRVIGSLKLFFQKIKLSHRVILLSGFECEIACVVFD